MPRLILESPERSKLLCLLEGLRSYVFGCPEQTQLMVLSLIAGWNLYALGDRGTGKTWSAKVLARLISGANFQRIQGEPDLLPVHIHGSYVQEKGEWIFRPGPLNQRANILLFDEISRTQPRTQAALFEPMEERHFTVEGNRVDLAPVFMLIGTGNRFSVGVYPLPEAQRDRFGAVMDFGRPTRGQLDLVLAATRGNRHNESAINPVISLDDVMAIRVAVEQVAWSESAQRYAREVVMRSYPEETHQLRHYVNTGVSPRASLAMLEMGRVLAFLEGSARLDIDHVKRLVMPCLRHRIELTDEAQVDESKTVDGVIQIILSQIAVTED